MVTLRLQLNQGIPQYACSSCSDCKSIFGKSLCSFKNRGCCWYFPKLTLHEIHKMSKFEDGIKILSDILKLSNVKIYNYYIHAKGYFDQSGYKSFLDGEQCCEDNVPDRSIFFRACPFVKPGYGCTLAEKYRSYICNFYICEDLVKELGKHDDFESYIRERNSYVNWIQWENQSLEKLLAEKNINLVSNFDEVINTFKHIPLDNYEFPQLHPISTGSEVCIGA